MSTKYNPTLSDFDLDRGRGAQGELWISNILDAMAQRTASIECKTDSYYMSEQSETFNKRGINAPRFYIEMECRGRDGVWRRSSLARTKADTWCIKFGKHPAGVIIETVWLKRAVEHAAKNPKQHGFCSYGKNPTRGVFIYMSDIHATRDKDLDEH